MDWFKTKLHSPDVDGLTIPNISPLDNITLSETARQVTPAEPELLTIVDIMIKCNQQLSETLHGYSNLSRTDQIYENCDFCNLSRSELDVLYADTTCVRSKYYPMPLFCVLYGLVFVLGLLGNLLVLWTVVRGGRALSSVMHLFICNLAVGDTLMVVLCVPFTVTAVMLLHYWPFGYILCVGVSYLQVSTGFREYRSNFLHCLLNQETVSLDG